MNDFQFDKNLLELGDEVEFSVEEGDRGLKATRVRLAGTSANGAKSGSGDAQRDPAPPKSSASRREPEYDNLGDVLSQAEFSAEVTEALLESAPAVTAEQIVRMRRRLVELAQEHGWVEL